MGLCRNCRKQIPDKVTFCSKQCAEDYKEKSVKPIDYSETGLKEVYDFLDLNEPKDGRLVIKADIMKKIIHLTSKWKMGKKREWIDKLSILTCVSTRKIREDYIQPLITTGILAETIPQVWGFAQIEMELQNKEENWKPHIHTLCYGRRNSNPRRNNISGHRKNRLSLSFV